jgi:competence protein ComEC
MRRLTLLHVLALCLVLASALVAQPRRPLDVYFVDVEGGAATLIVTPAGESMLIDSGNPGDRDAGRIARVAREQAGLKQIDHVLITHWHGDHVGGVGPLGDLLPIGRFYDRGLPAEPLANDIRADLMEVYRKRSGGRVHLKAGDEVELRQPTGQPPLNLRVLASGGVVSGEPANAPHLRECGLDFEHRPIDESDNANSLALQLSFGAFELYAGGDLTWNVEHKLLCPPPQVRAVDAFLVSHHGLDSSNHPGLVRALRPAVAIFNNGPKKGAQPRTFTTVQAAPGLEAIFQLHRNLQEGGHNTEAAHIANDEENCRGEFIKLSVAPNAGSYEVHVPAKGTRRAFRTRS